jgi:ferredoxin-type protein NapH
MKLTKRLRKTSQIAFLIILISPILGYDFVYYGSMISSEVFGIEVFDPVAFIELFAAANYIPVASIFGVLLTLGIYFVFGGRSFCGWVCPVNTVTELFEKKTESIREKNKNRFSLKNKVAVLVFTAIFSFVLGFPVFTTISPIGFTSKAITFLSIGSLLPLVSILLIEYVFPRIWCRSLCPVGGFYSLLAKISPTKMKIEIDNCTKCNKCKYVCPSHELLDKMVAGKANSDTSGECLFCLECKEVCETDALYVYKKPKKLGVLK